MWEIRLLNSERPWKAAREHRQEGHPVCRVQSHCELPGHPSQVEPPPNFTWIYIAHPLSQIFHLQSLIVPEPGHTKQDVVKYATCLYMMHDGKWNAEWCTIAMLASEGSTGPDTLSLPSTFTGTHPLRTLPHSSQSPNQRHEMESPNDCLSNPQLTSHQVSSITSPFLPFVMSIYKGKNNGFHYDNFTHG